MMGEKEDLFWYKDAVIYELRVGSFFDGNDDGIGDFPGLTRKLDYLQDLGVTALWLLPFYHSPMKDDGYDIADYTKIQSSHGTLSQFKHFLHEAHKRDLKVITELVLNHTSMDHPWFQRARKAKPGSKWRNYYLWSDRPDKFKDVRIIFQDFESSNWAWDPVAKAYYWHRFFTHQPDLNYDSPDVRKEIFQVIDFWLAMGIDGFRLDAIPYLYKREGTLCENLPETHTFLKELRRYIDENYPGRMLLAEANQWPQDAAIYFGAGDECHMAFHFPVMPRLFMSLQMEDSFPVIDIVKQTPQLPENCQWAIFLRNHDELTLEMVTDEERDYMYRIYAKDPKARINLGIKHRLAPLLENDRRRIELMNGLLFSLPGTPVIYYGDEIGMGDNIYLGDRNGVRTPMQWSCDRNAGFSKTNPQKLFLPVISDPQYHYNVVNVENQQNNSQSLFWTIKRMISLRKRFKAFSQGVIQCIETGNRKVLAFLRGYEREKILVVANFSRFPLYLQLDLSAYQGWKLVELFGGTEFPLIKDQPYFLSIGRHSFYWFSLEPVVESLSKTKSYPSLEIENDWTNFFFNKERANRILSLYLKGAAWLAGSGIRSATIVDKIPLNGYFLLLVQIEITDTSQELILLPIGFTLNEQVLREQERSVIARLVIKSQGEETFGMLYEADRDKHFYTKLLKEFLKSRSFKGSNGRLIALIKKSLDREAVFSQGEESGWIAEEPSNLVFLQKQQLVLKLFRYVEPGISQELDMNCFLTDQQFPFVPPLKGSFVYENRRGETFSIGLLQDYISNQGSAWHFTLDEVERFSEEIDSLSLDPKAFLKADKPFVELAQLEPPAAILKCMGTYLEGASRMGVLTAQLHLTLASYEHAEFSPEPYTLSYQRALYQSARIHFIKAFQLLREKLELLDPPLKVIAEKLIANEENFIQIAQRLQERKINISRIRCHGDYRLENLLYTGKDFFILDFAGWAFQKSSGRRYKKSALRDAASMIISFHYAAYLVLQRRIRRGVATAETFLMQKNWMQVWIECTTSAFLKSYLGAAKEAPFIPTDRSDLQFLLDLFLLEGAANHLERELTLLKDSVEVPLRIIEEIYQRMSKGVANG